MKRLLVTVLGSLLVSTSCMATMLDLNVLGGVKKLSKTDWQGNDVQGAVGVEAVATPPLFPVSVVGGYLHTASTDKRSFSGSPRVSLKGETQEVWLGVGKKLDLPLIHFLVSAGPVFIRARFDQSSSFSAPVDSSHDNGFGYYLSGSAFVQVLGHLNLGAQIRYSAAKVNIDNRDAKAGGMTYLGLIGLAI